MESCNRDIAGFEIKYDEFKDVCRHAWKDESSNHFYKDKSKKELNFVFATKAKKIIECIPTTTKVLRNKI